MKQGLINFSVRSDVKDVEIKREFNEIKRMLKELQENSVSKEQLALYTLPQLAQYYGKSKATIMRMKEDGRLDEYNRPNTDVLRSRNA